MVSKLTVQQQKRGVSGSNKFFPIRMEYFPGSDPDGIFSSVRSGSCDSNIFSPFRSKNMRKVSVQ